VSKITPKMFKALEEYPMYITFSPWLLMRVGFWGLIGFPLKLVITKHAWYWQNEENPT
jgi:hypothetical protein